MLNFWGPKKYKKVINSSTKCLISVKIAIMTPHIIPLPLVNVWLIFDLQKYVNWLCVFWKVNPFFQKAQVFCMDLQPAADPYNVVCRVTFMPSISFMNPVHTSTCALTSLGGHVTIFSDKTTFKMAAEPIIQFYMALSRCGAFERIIW